MLTAPFTTHQLADLSSPPPTRCRYPPLPHAASLAAIRLAHQLEKSRKKFPPKDDPLVNRAWKATPNSILARREPAVDAAADASSRSGGDGTRGQDLNEDSAEDRALPRIVRFALNAAAPVFQPMANKIQTSTIHAEKPQHVNPRTSPPPAQPLDETEFLPILPHSVDHFSPPSPPPATHFPPTLHPLSQHRLVLEADFHPHIPHCGPPSPPPSPRSAPAILDSDGEEEFRYYQGLIRADGWVPAACVRTLLAAGINAVGSAQPTAQLAHRLTANCSDLRARIRTEALGLFNSYWSEDGAWRQEVFGFNPYISSRGVNIAGFMGSLYRVGILSGRDAHECLTALLSTALHLRLLAAHALFVQCGDRICAGDSGIRTVMIRDRLSARTPQGLLVWGPIAESYALVCDWLENIDRWLATQTMKHILAVHDGTPAPPPTPAGSPTCSSSLSDMSLSSSVSSFCLMTPRTETS
ncbi:hypothetical protein C8R43DRAFT_1242837 [Mycena crocata]|nr:hypothetical protein C8R43DRAFT_1242837 [Mycena crocata]